MKRVVQAVVFLAVALAAVWFLLLNPSLPGQSANNPAMEAAIQKETEQLIGNPRTFQTTSEKALAARAAITKGDYAQAGKIVADVFAVSKIQNWRFYPFREFMEAVSDTENPAFEQRLDAWVEADKTSALPYLMRAEYFYDMGWKTRGTRFSSNVRSSSMRSFGEYMDKALADINAAMSTDTKNPYMHFLKMGIILGAGNTPELEKAFQEAIAKYPGYYNLYHRRLILLSPKWGGSVEEMYAFVDKYAGGAPEHSPLKMLYLELFSQMVDASRIMCDSYRSKGNDEYEQCISGAMSTVTPGLEKGVEEALGLYAHTDKHQFTVVLERILKEMIGVPGGDKYGNMLLQLAADSMGTDIQMVEKNPAPGRNNYMLDTLTALGWYYKGNAENAEKKYREALQDISTAPFPDEEEKDIALAEIYGYMAKLYFWQAQHDHAIAYQTAAEVLGGGGESPDLICHAYFNLKDYHAAVTACTKSLEKSSTYQARYWRGRAHRALGETDAALADYKTLADSEDADNFRAGAIIEMSVIYGERNDLQNMLRVLTDYPFLYDEQRQRKQDLAVSYNNRCYAYMHLGDLEKALADCTASLKFGSLPDAYSKQQELIKRLNAHEQGT